MFINEQKREGRTNTWRLRNISKVAIGIATLHFAFQSSYKRKGKKIMYMT